MKDKIFRGLWILGCCVLGEVPMAEPVGDRVQVALKNGDFYSGSLLTDSAGGLQLQPYWLDRSLPFAYEDLKTFQKLDPETPRESTLYRLNFPAGNQLRATAVRLDADDFVVRTLWGEELRIPRQALESLEFLGVAGLLYSGPNQISPGGQKVQQALVIPKAGMQWQTEGIQFPEKFLLEMEIQPAVNNFVYQIYLFDWRSRASGSVVFEMTANQISSAWYQRIDPNRLRVENWREKIPESGGRQQLCFYVNLPGKEITLRLNGKNIHTWGGDLTESLQVSVPSNIGFRYLSGSGEISIQSVRIFPWDGFLPSDPERNSKDFLQLKNGKSVAGHLLQLDEKTAILRTGAEDEITSFPVGEIVKVVLSPDGNRIESVPPVHAVKLTLQEGAEPLMLQESSLEAGKLSGKVWTGAEPFTLSIPLRALRRLEFPESPSP